MEITDNIIAKRLFRGFIYLHILYHASVGPFYGSWMLEELSNHGYKLSPGTLYPILHSLENSGLLLQESRNVQGRIRKYYSITEKGVDDYREALQFLRHSVREIRL